MTVRVRRIYEPPEPDDGVRVLVDRLWPRGISTRDAHVDQWPKLLSPSPELRRWYHEGGGSFDDFRHRYETELAAPEASGLLEEMRKLVRNGPVTLVTASRSPGRGHASVLAELLAAEQG